MSVKRPFILVGTAALLLFGLAVFFVQVRPALQRRHAMQMQHEVRRPEAQKISSEPVDPPMKNAEIPAAVSVEEVNLPVPFTSQAPLFVWDALHKEACEEASIAMGLAYFTDLSLETPEESEQQILRLVGLAQEMNFTIDLTAQETMILLQKLAPHLQVSLLKNPDATLLKDSLRQGKLIIVPASGTELQNPYFQRPGPVYHMLVLRGFTRDGYFITNDPGTKRGEEFVYPMQRIMDAMHDWNGGDVMNGEKVVVVVGQA